MRPARPCWRDRPARLGHPRPAGRGRHRRQAAGGGLRAPGRPPARGPPLPRRSCRPGRGRRTLAFTSANGVAAFAARFGERGLPAYAVGAATAAAAREAGFASVTSADGDVAALVSVVAAHAPFAGEVLHPGAAEPAGDLIGALAALGVPARALTAYETVAPRPEWGDDGDHLPASRRAAAFPPGPPAFSPATCARDRPAA